MSAGDGETEALGARALDWALGDPDPATAAEIAGLVQAGDVAGLRERFDRPLTFGTAGLRGVVGGGPGRMNRATVIRATRAVADHLLATEPRARTAPVVVGFDARHTSAGFAEAVVRVLGAAGIPVRCFAEAVPTPLAAYAVRALQGSAAIVVTASHNPREYNGFKVFGAHGAQVVAPADSDIERRMAALGPARAIPCAAGDVAGEPVPADLVDRYVAEVVQEIPRGAADRAFPIVYTPLHGVGGRFATRALREAGFEDVRVVAEQAEPDGSFPTVRFPNPEEREALTLALERARESGAELVLANDPDADRLAACVPDESGGWTTLTGNQMGILLADFVLDRTRARAGRPLLVQTLVSTPMTEALARSYGARFERTLTGFKWIMTAAREIERREGARFAFGFEEAIGFAVGGVVRDKDGIGAAVAFAELAAACRAAGKTVLARLRELLGEHGLWVSAQWSITREGRDGALAIDRAVDRAAATPPATVLGMTVQGVTDYRVRASERPEWLGAAPVVELDLGSSGRVLLRPSGTEPKLKIYVDLCSAPADPAAEAALAARARAAANDVARHLGL